MPGLFEEAEAGETTTTDTTTTADTTTADTTTTETTTTDTTAQGERPDWLPEAAWKDGAVDMTGLQTAFASAGKAADLPADADSYTLPTIEGFDAEKAGSSPIIKAMRGAAFASGMGQAGFETAVKDYVAAESERYGTEAAAERAKLGSNAPARLKAVASFVRSSVPGAEGEAILAMATNADAVIGLEKLMNSRAAPKPRADPPATEQRKTKEQIEGLMAGKSYSGKPSERDPAVVKEVNDWFAAEAAAKKP